MPCCPAIVSMLHLCTMCITNLAHQVACITHDIAPQTASLHVATVGSVQAESQQQCQGKAGEMEGV